MKTGKVDSVDDIKSADGKGVGIREHVPKHWGVVTVELDGAALASVYK